MEAITLLIQALKGQPAAFTLTVGFVFAVFALYLHSRKVDIADVTSIGATLSAQLKAQSELVQSLSKQVAELHEQNVGLMGELRKANKKIDELETMLKDYQANEPHTSSGPAI